MTNREPLVEQYEDALFALLMEGVAEAEGEEALRLNEKLKSDPDAEVPEVMRRRCEKTIRTAFAKRQLRAMGRTSARWFTRVAVIAALCGLMFTAAFALSEGFRISTLNAIIQVTEYGTQIAFHQTSHDAEDNATTPYGQNVNSHFLVNWLPDGYQLTDEYIGTELNTTVFSNDINSYISIENFHYSETTVYNFDTENTSKKEISICGHEATLYIKDSDAVKEEYFSMPQIESEMTLIWIDTTTHFIWQISATNLTEEEMIQVAEGIQIVE